MAKTGDGTNGQTWETAFIDLQDALSVATSGDEIWVAQGIYTPGSTVSETFQLEEGVSLYGGFAATETLRIQRDWLLNVTVLSGDISGDDTTDADGVVTDPANIIGSNSYHVVYSEWVTETAVLDGFTITAGQADGVSTTDDGGGMFNYASNPTLTDITFSGN